MSDELKEITQAFDLFDSDRIGFITLTEFGTSMHSLGYDRYLNSNIKYDPLMIVLSLLLKSRSRRNVEDYGKLNNLNNLNNITMRDITPIITRHNIKLNPNQNNLGDSQLSLNDLLDLMTLDNPYDLNDENHSNQSNKSEELQQFRENNEIEINITFDLLDFDNNGSIGLEEIRKLCTDLDFQLSDEFILNLLGNSKSQNSIDRSEMHMLMTKKTFP